MTTTRPTDPVLAALRRRWPRLRWKVEHDYGRVIGYREATTRIRVRQTHSWYFPGNAWVSNFGGDTCWGRTPVEAASRAIRTAVREARRTLAALPVVPDESDEPGEKGEGEGR